MVPVFGPEFDGVFELGDAVERGVGESFAGEDREPAFDYPALGGVSIGTFWFRTGF